MQFLAIESKFSNQSGVDASNLGFRHAPGPVGWYQRRRGVEDACELPYRLSGRWARVSDSRVARFTRVTTLPRELTVQPSFLHVTKLPVIRTSVRVEPLCE